MAKILGLDLGTNSIGIAVRDNAIDGDLNQQLAYFSSSIFKSGVGNGKTGEFSYAAERTSYRLTRNRYKARKYRRFSTLKALVAAGLCPLTTEQLNRWSQYDKAAGLRREYPSDAILFEQWIRLDFNGDGVADYPSPFHLRAELVCRRFDLDDETERFKLGRALYHFALHRGFKSSKGESLKEQEDNETADGTELDITELKKSEEKKSSKIVEYMEAHSLPTVGCACAHLLDEGIRVRESEYQPVRAQLKEEVQKILEAQGFTSDDTLWKAMLSEKKGEGTIFYKRPLRSQKGNVGLCTLEPGKKRCPISHPEFELFRAWSFINNIRFRYTPADDWQELPLELKRELFEAKCLRQKDSFDFKEICDWLKKKTASSIVFSKKAGTINFSDKTGVPCCPISTRLKKILGEDWRTIVIPTDIRRTVRHKDGTETTHAVNYTYEDLWHVCFSADEADEVVEFATNKLHWDENDAKTKDLVRLWFGIRDGYAQLSLKAIRNINVLLMEGIIYSNAVMMAKIPELIGQQLFDDNREGILDSLKEVNEKARQVKLIYGIANTLIANYKSLDYKDQFAFKNSAYKLVASDFDDIRRCCEDVIGNKSWNETFSEAERQALTNEVADLYQQFFVSEERDYFKTPRADAMFAEWLQQEFAEVQNLDRLYHPSMIEFYAPAKEEKIGDTGVWMKQLGSPVIGAIRNPMAMRVLHTLRRQVNSLLKQHVIDEDTRVVVETARELNDANMRWALHTWNERRKEENKEYTKKIADTYPGRDISETDIRKYRFWVEQNHQCIYTGEVIGAAELLDGNRFDIEHTLPRSKSFDDSQKNQTLCSSVFNRNVKQNRLPCELTNYDEILERIKPWMENIEKLKGELNAWKSRSRSAATKDRKDKCMRERHLRELELDYWEGKVARFTMKEIPQGFRNNQLNDTRIITKYAYHYLRSLFTRVDVQRGETTAAYRKMLGLQSIEEKKDRSKHSHHAIDAAVLTFIPGAAQRERMLELFYRIEEESALGHNVDELRNALQKERRSCGLGIVPDVSKYIEEHILINHISKDQTFVPANRKLRSNGKVRMTSNGTPMRTGGDSFRAQINVDSLYGAVKWRDGKIDMVKRKPITALTEKDIEKNIVDAKVKKAIEEAVVKYMSEGDSFAVAITKPIWMLDSDGAPHTTDCNGRQLNPIRHVRCRVNTAVTYAKAVKLKPQTYHSHKSLVHLEDRSHKELYYSISGGNYICLIYAGVVKNKLERKYRFLTNSEAAALRFQDAKMFFDEPHFAQLIDKKNTYSLQSVIKAGTKVLMWKESPDELFEPDCNLNQRLYVVYKFNNAGSDYVYLKQHLEVKESNVEAVPFGASEYQGTLKLGANNFNCLVEGIDFFIDYLGRIQLKSND